MRISLLLSFFILCGPSHGFAQVQTDTLTLGEFTVESTRIRKPVLDQPVQVANIDSNQIALQFGKDLGELLSSFTSIYIRSNGPGAASVISQRGLGGDQTRVLWEGMPLNHQMLGVTDLSLIPATMFSEVEVTSGSGSAYNGSGIGGTVFLKNGLISDHAGISQSIGSFGNKISQAEAGVSNGNFSMKVYASTQRNENDYRYYDANTNSLERRNRGALDNDQLMSTIGWKKNNLQLKSSLWLSRVDHELTENIFAGPGTADQYDESLRWVNNLKYFTDHSTWEGRLYAGSTTLDYTDPQKGINSLSESRTVSSELRYTYFNWEDLELGGALAGSYTEIETNNYTELKSRNTISNSIHASYTMDSGLKLYPALRLDHYDDFGTSLSPSLGMNYSLIEDKLSVRVLAARNFRAPTFNDLYWPSGGNENLNAEKGLKTELGMVHQTGGDRLRFRQQLSAYYIRLYDGIKWQPNALGEFKAQNIQEITSQSVEWSGEMFARIGDVRMESRHSLSYTRAFFSKERFPGDQAKGNQLPYVPSWKYNGSIHFSHKGWAANISGVYVDERFTTEQGSAVNTVESYVVFNSTLKYSKTISNTRFAISGMVNNVFNERYDVVRFYPMPLRNLMINLSINQQF